MNMDELFAMGFCKAAEEHGVDPVQLAKYAAGEEIKKWDPLGPEAYVRGNAVTNNTGIYHLPSPIGGPGWNPSKRPIVALRPGEIEYLPSPASVTNSPSSTWMRSTPNNKETKPFWKKVQKKDGTVVNVPASLDALINLQHMAH